MTDKQLSKTMQEHRDWVSSGGTKGVRADLRAVDLSNSKLSGVDFRWVDARAADFSRSDLTDADFRHADLRGAKFDEACCQRASFVNAKMQGSSMQGTDLRGADMQYADMTGSSLIAAARGLPRSPSQSLSKSARTKSSPEPEMG